MITVGFYCDQCRAKYADHLCKKGLPCRHEKKAAIHVGCQAFGRHSEHVCIGRDDVWISKAEDRGVMYCSAEAYLFWGSMVEFRKYDDAPTMRVGEWLASKPDAFVRAFLHRWDSSKHVPEWVAFRDHPAAIRARAMVKSQRLALIRL